MEQILTKKEPDHKDTLIEEIEEAFKDIKNGDVEID